MTTNINFDEFNLLNNNPLLKFGIYILKRGDLISSNVYKIGKTERTLYNRFNEYNYPGTYILDYIPVSQISFTERHILINLKNNNNIIKRCDLGNEYFEGDYTIIYDIVMTVCNEYKIINTLDIKKLIEYCNNNHKPTLKFNDSAHININNNLNEINIINEELNSFDKIEHDLFYNAINNNTDYQIAEYYAYKNREYLFINNNNVYYFNNGFWNIINDNYYTIKKHLSNEFYNIFYNELIRIKNLLNTSNNNIIQNQYTKYIKKLNNICLKLKSNYNIKNIIKDILITCVKDNINFDSHIFYLNFLNGTLNLQTKEFIKHDPTHYITKQILLNYEPNKYSKEEKLKLIFKLRSFFPTIEELD